MYYRISVDHFSVRLFHVNKYSMTIPDMVPLQCHLISHLQQNYSRDIKVEEKPQTEDSKGKNLRNSMAINLRNNVEINI